MEERQGGGGWKRARALALCPNTFANSPMVAPSPPTHPSRLAADAAALADDVLPLSVASAAAFLEAHPLPSIVE